MSVLTADDFSTQMVAQLRVREPSISAEVGTPERKILDSVAEALAANQVDLTGLAGALDITSKFGSNLDQFTSLFGFARQASTAASGYVVFSCNNPTSAVISIPAGTTIQCTQVNANGQYSQYYTTAGGLIPQGQTQSGAIPVICSVAGSQGNAPANTLTQIVGQFVLGVTSVINAAPVTGGQDVETDASYKVRFQNTVFRNLAGTEDQYLATAVSTAFTTIANVIGPQSKYQEYVQVPNYDDAGYLLGAQIATTVSGTQVIPTTGTYTLTVGSNINLPNQGLIYVGGVTQPITYTGKSGTTQLTGCSGGAGQTAVGAQSVIYQGSGGTQGQWTTALSSIPYARDIYTDPQAFVSNGQIGANLSYFYRPGTDFNYNYPPVIAGDAWREAQAAGTIAPNFTFLNVFNPPTGTAAAGLQALQPGSVILSEFRYLSSASRNSISHNVQNCVDVYVNGFNPTQTSTTFLAGASPFNANLFNTAPNSATYIENFRRDGEPNQRPHPGNYFTPLFQTPLTALPTNITIGTTVYYLGYHYWLVHDISTYQGSVRSRDGIEWSTTLAGDAGSQAPPGWPNPTAANLQQPYVPTGATFTSQSTQQITVNNYQYDANVPVLQGAIEAVRQVTTDVLVHSARPRYFKVDITVVYASNANPAVVNTAIETALQAYFQRQFFGTIIRLADLLDTIYQVPGVDNVRWSNDLPTLPNQIRIIETDAFGNPLHTPVVDRINYGTVATVETQRIYIYGGTNNYAAGDTFKLIFSDPAIAGGAGFTTQAIGFNSGGSFPATAAGIQSAIQTAASAAGAGVLYTSATVSADSWSVSSPMASFLITYGTNGTPYLPIVTTQITQSPYDFEFDFFLRDNELPVSPSAASADTVAGAIIRPRAQNVWVRPGIG